MKKVLRGMAAFVLCGSIVLSSAACGKKKAGKTAKVVQESDTYYSAETIELPLPQADSNREVNMAIVDHCYFLKSVVVASYAIDYQIPKELSDKYQNYIMNPFSMNEEDSQKLLDEVYSYSLSGLVIYNLDGSTRCTIPEKTGDPSHIAKVMETDDGRLLALVEYYGQAPDWNLTYSIAEIDANGETTKLFDLDNENEMFHDILLLDNGGFIGVGYQEIVELDETGKKVASDANNIDNSVLQQVFCQDGQYYGLFEDMTSIVNATEFLRKFDINTGKFAPESIDVPYSGLLTQGNDGVYFLEGDDVEKIDIASCSTEKVLFSWNNVDLNRKGINSICFRSEEEIYVVQVKTLAEDPYFFNLTDPKINLVKLTKEAKNPHAGKSIIEIASSMNYAMLPDVLLDRIVEYNLNSENKTRIEFVDYSTISTIIPSTETDKDTLISQTVDKVYLDMQNGSGPDILLDFGEFSQFDNEKILLDLNTMIDGENGLNRDEYMDNIFRACEKDGHLYQMPIIFSASGMVVDKQYTQGKESWSYDDLLSVIDSLPDNKSMIGETYWVDVLKELLYSNGRSFIDYEKRTVHFDDPEFLKILEIAKKIGSLRTSDEILQSDMEQYYSGTNINVQYLKQGMTASAICKLIHILEFAEYEASCSGGVDFIGTPGNEIGGLSAEYNMSIGISKNSSYQKEAWDFVKYLLEEDAQVECVHLVDGFPVNREACKKVLSEQVGRYEKAIENPTVGYAQELLESYPVLNSETVDRAMAVLDNIFTVKTFDKTVFLLIKEEAEGYIKGDRSAEDVAKNIQNRTATVVNER
ncbi:MAG: extracellular solute-binding protein [Clostridiales bacterium]|nr:extracellular solute-binding protein [Clostridiales bacterium]